MTADELREHLGAGHRNAWEWALHVCHQDREAAGDVLQQVYLMVLDGRARFDGRSTFRTWLFGVIRRQAAGQRRTEWRRRWLLGRHAHPVDEAEAPLAPLQLERDEEVQRLATALAQLSPRQQAVLELVFHHDLTIEEAATVLRVSLGTARTHYTRGKQQLVALLGPRPEEA